MTLNSFFFYITQRGGISVRKLLNKVTGRTFFEVDESFVFEELKHDLTEECQALMNLFISQSKQEKAMVKEEGISPRYVKGFYYRICDVPLKICDGSPLEEVEYPERISNRKGSVFAHKGQMIHTDGTGKRTKLTKIYKRRDNRGTLLKALRRMRLNL